MIQRHRACRGRQFHRWRLQSWRSWPRCGASTTSSHRQVAARDRCRSWH